MALVATPTSSFTPAERALGRVGLVIAGRYMLVGLLGRGAMGEVWRAHHAALEADVAIKLVHVPTVQDEAFQRLLVEARAAANIQSPYVARSFDFGRDGELAYIAMELLEGETLDERLARQRALSLQDTARVFADITKGVAAAHARGIIHRDLKPQNVFIARTDSGTVAKVLDFGIAKTNGTLRTQEGIVVGTPAYLSREQVLGTRPVDGYADLWALAIMAYECVTGRLPYDSSTMTELFVEIAGRALERKVRDPALPPAFRAWLQVALAREPERRFPDALTLGHALERALVDQLAPPRPARPAHTTLLVGGTALAATAAVVAAAALLVGSRGAGPARAADPAAASQTSSPPAVSTEVGPRAAASAQLASAAAPAPPATASASSSASTSASVKRPKRPHDPWGF